jgi:hypothetical protein
MQNFARGTLWMAATSNIDMENSVFVKMACKGVRLSNVDSIELAHDLMHGVVLHVLEMHFVFIS